MLITSDGRVEEEAISEGEVFEAVCLFRRYGGVCIVFLFLESMEDVCKVLVLFICMADLVLICCREQVKIEEGNGWFVLWHLERASATELVLPGLYSMV